MLTAVPLPPSAGHAAGDPDVHLLSSVDRVGNIEINAFQRSANVIVQKSLGEGFGLTVAEARWKSKPVGGSCGDLRAQDRRTGYLVNVEECAGRAVTLLHDSTATAEMGAAGREVVRERLLSPRDIDDFSEMLEVLS